MEKIGKIGKNWEKLEKNGKKWKKMEKIGKKWKNYIIPLVFGNEVDKVCLPDLIEN